ncbi:MULTISPECIES: helix-turn-helix transcriptional regulator [unclassified Isoptericola]|uniref:helix-turn-helix domain-containing protein n=1 Tax=unclassified Isoptericola TaxID=2623355 RepID=UPI00271225D7|nr:MULTISPECIES: helix-turn-helix transcriptional regulator [unclassified Isoptericola]MDO8147826.1 helix-turn-helix transcriptional regulator [Isoptericola sp. b515]MDO8149915.1 helix-turn-helix transcriptional regulator [Isoptericola sp. b408]
MLRFRNIDASPEDPVSSWGIEGLSTALERGYLPHWQRIARAVRDEPHGTVARQLETALTVVEPNGATALLSAVLAQARESDRAAVARSLREHVRRSGLTAQELAAAVGTSPSRLSTYLSGRVVPSAAIARRIARTAEEHARRGRIHPGGALDSPAA